MKITKHGFPPIMADSDQLYMDFITAALKHSDPEAAVIFHKLGDDMKVFITPSEPDFRQSIINDILGAHRMLHLKVIFSKSLAKQKIVSYDISFE